MTHQPAKFAYTQPAQCDGKRAFETPALAWAAAKRRPGRVAYRCAFCGLYHVGTDRTVKKG